MWNWGQKRSKLNSCYFMKNILHSAKILLLPSNYEKLRCHPIIYFSNIAIARLNFSLLLLVKFSLLILFPSFSSVLCFFLWLSFWSYRSSNYRDSYICPSFSLLKAPLRAITIWEAIQKRSHEPIYTTHTKI